MTAGNEAIGGRLRKVRDHLGLTQPKMSAKIGVSFRAYQTYEAGTNKPRAEDLAVLANSGVDLHWLLTGAGSMLLDVPRVEAPPPPPVDHELLAQIIEGVELLLLKMGKSLVAEKKARVVAMLYRAFSADRHIDMSTIKEMIDLAA